MSELQRLALAQIKPGMFIAEVESRGTGVKVKAGGIVRNDALIEKMRQQGVVYAYVDFERSELEQDTNASSEETEEANKDYPTRSGQKKQSMKAEAARAERIHKVALRLQEKIVEQVKGGDQIDLDPIQDTANNVMESIFRNPNAMLFMSRVKEKDNYLFEHATNVTSIMTAFASNLKMDEAEIQQIAIGSFLKDIGTVLVSDKVVKCTGKYTPEAYELMKKHVTYSEKILTQVPGMTELALDVAINHHERLDGSGYPNGHTGAKLSQVARMIAIVDSYDAMISDRPHKRAMTSTQAFKELLKHSKWYDQDLVQRFIKFLGVHPVGSLVILRSGKIGVVYQENIKEPLKPIVACFYNSKSRHHIPLKKVNLAAPMVDDEIAKAIKPEEFAIDFGRFMRESLL